MTNITKSPVKEQNKYIEKLKLHELKYGKQYDKLLKEHILPQNYSSKEYYEDRTFI